MLPVLHDGRVTEGPVRDGVASDAGESSDAERAWQAEARGAVTTLAVLERHLTLTAAEREGVRRAEAEGFPFSITPYYLALCDRHDPTCPIRRQCVPTAVEAQEVPGDLRDPLGEEEHEVAPHLVQRYPDRVLLLATDHCGVYCRFCTRSRMVGAGAGARSLAALEGAFAYVEGNPNVREVIVSGGDPGLMSSTRIGALLGRLARIAHVDHVRFATRVPVTLPPRVTPSFVGALRAHPATWLMTHFNHPKELTPAALTALARLADGGVPVMNHTVLLRGVNDSAEVLEALFRGLVRARARPYYLLQADPVRGTGHLRTPLARGIELMGALQGRVSGIALPKFIVDTPRGRGKVPVGPNAIVSTGAGTTTLRTFRGEHVVYVDPPGTESL